MIRLLSLTILLMLCAEVSAQALFQQASENSGRGSFYQVDPEAPRPWAVHDLVTIKIDQNVLARRSDSIETNKSMRLKAEINDWMAIDGGTGNLVTAAPLSPSIDVSSDYEIENDGIRNRISKFSDVITAEVIQILPNGHLKVAAYKEIRVMGDTERFELTCTIDPEWVDVQTKSIDAERCAHLRLRYTGDGDVSDSASTGWLTDIINFIWPF
ncbi:MAG: flagellar basal body L-ring protein FlgH [Planctomycetes bacterium]|nr:flagellar basal body L-ring protein FlgH [Planctomycetota bacterium]